MASINFYTILGITFVGYFPKPIWLNKEEGHDSEITVSLLLRDRLDYAEATDDTRLSQQKFISCSYCMSTVGHW